MRDAERSARKDLWRLLRLPREEWADRVTNARTRMRSRAFARLLIEECRQRVKTDPLQAAALAALVRPALDRTEGRLAQLWAISLMLRAEAHRANALRVAGDLTSAGRLFSEVLAHLATGDDYESRLRAEVLSLAASLEIDQRQFSKAERLLNEAACAYLASGDRVGHCKTLVKKANLCLTLGRPQEVPALLQQAVASIDPHAEPYLYFCTLQARALAYLELGRPDEAAELMAEERPLWLEEGTGHTAALYTDLQARIAIARGHHDQAAAGFTATRDRLLVLGRDYDAILVSLDLADALLAAGRSAEAGHLARDLVPLFRSRGVARETLACLRLLAEAARQEAVTAALVAEVRERLTEAAS